MLFHRLGSHAPVTIRDIAPKKGIAMPRAVTPPFVRSAICGLVVLTAAGCGSSAPSKASYITKADGICSTYNAKGKALPKPTASTPAATATYLDTVVSVLTDETDKLKALKTPSGDGKTLTAIYAKQQDQATQLKTAAGQLTSGDATAAAAKVQALLAGNPAVNQAFDSYGLNTCGSSS